MVTLGSIAAVAIAGAFAVSANLGILDSASSSPIGNVAAAGDLVPTTAPGATTSDATAPTAAPTTTAAAVETRVQEFLAADAATVAVARTGDGVRLDRVVPSPGWTWQLVDPGPAAVVVELRDGRRTIRFTATPAADGSVDAGVEEVTAASPQSGPSVGGRGDADDEWRDHEEREHDDRDHHDRDRDQDEREYEGGDDDD